MADEIVKYRLSGSYYLPHEFDSGFALSSGSTAYIGSFVVPTEMANDIERFCKTRLHHTLEIEYKDRPPAKFDRLIFLTSKPTEDRYRKRLIFADKRYNWNRERIRRAYNTRTLAGDKSIPEAPGAVINNLTMKNVPNLIQNEVGWRSISLYPPEKDRDNPEFNARKWTLREIIEDVLKDIKSKFSMNYDLSGLGFIDTLDFEGIYLDHPHSQALDIVMSEIPEWTYFVDYDGVIRFYNRSDGSEYKPANDLHFEFEGQGRIEVVDHSNVCPSEMVFEITPEYEVRYDYDQDTSVTQPKRGKESRYMQTVAPCPDPNLAIPGEKEKTLSGQFRTFDDYFKAWTGLRGGIKLSHNLIKTFYVTGGMYENLARAGQQDFDVNWVDRIATIKNHYLQTFQLPKTWVDKSTNWRPIRLILINQAQGTFAPSMAYVDCSLKVNERGRLANGSLSPHINVVGSWAKRLTDGKVNTYTKVNMLDGEQGIVEVIFSPDPLRHADPYPALVKNAPTFDLSDKNKPRYIYEEKNGLRPALVDHHKLSFVLTGSPDPTNVGNGLFEYTVRPKDILGINPGLATNIGPNPGGHRMVIRVDPGLQTARFGWSDDDGIPQEIEKAWGVGKGRPNFQKIPFLNESNIKNLCLVLAAASWSKFTKRYLGSRTSPLNGLIRPSGTVAEVMHTVTSSGIPQTMITLQGEPIGYNFMNHLPKGLRAELLRQVKKGV